MFVSVTALLALSALSVAAPANPKVMSMAVTKKTYQSAIRGVPGNYIYTNVTVGTPPQFFEVTLDAGSADFWVPAQNGTEGGGPGIFNGSASSTFQLSTTEFFPTYVSGGAEGYWATDDMQAAGISLTKFQFGVMYQMQEQSRGLLGLSFAENENAPAEYNNFPFAAKAQGYIDHVLYSLHFDGPSSPDGTILFGGIDHAKYSGDLHYYPVSQPNAGPQIAIEGLDVNGAKLDINSAAVLDTGSLAVYVSQDQLGTIAQNLNLNLSNYNDVQGYFYLDCNAEMSIDFRFNGLAISANSSSLVMPESFFTGNASDTSCVFGIQNREIYPTAPPEVILGEPFLKNAYVVYDLEDYQIGIAPVIYTDKSDVQEV